jgi:hypothetical protein
MRVTMTAALLAAALLALAPRAHATALLYGVTGSGNSSSLLYTVDPDTGLTTLIGDTGLTHLTGLDFDPTSGTLYAVWSVPTLEALYTLDPGTAASTLIGSTGYQIPDITIGPDGVLRGWAERDGVGNDLDDPVVINKVTGATSPTSSDLDTGRTGIASLDATHIYLLNFDGKLYSVDVTDGTYSLLFGGMPTHNNMLENMPNGHLLTGQRGSGGTQFYEIDPSNGSWFPLEFADVEFSGLAYGPDSAPAPAPEPSSLVLLGGGVAALVVATRRKRKA